MSFNETAARSGAMMTPAEQRAAAVAGLEKCREVLGVENDPFRAVWRGADDATRRMLLTIAKRPVYLNSYFWDEMTPDTRAAIKRRAGALRDWLNKMPAGAF